MSAYFRSDEYREARCRFGAGELLAGQEIRVRFDRAVRQSWPPTSTNFLIGCVDRRKIGYFLTGSVFSSEDLTFTEGSSMPVVAEDLHPGTWVLDLCDTSTSMVGQVRVWASRHLVHLGDPHRADVLLTVTELLTNAYEHGNGPEHVQLWRSVTPCAVRIEVADFSTRLPIAEEEPRDPRGRGLLVVDRLAAAWGICQDTGRGKTVWAHVPCAGDSRRACRTVLFPN